MSDNRGRVRAAWPVTLATDIAVCYLEYLATRELLGELREKQVIHFWTTDHYTWVYKTVLERSRDIGQVMFKYKLVPSEGKK